MHYVILGGFGGIILMFMTYLLAAG